MSPNSKSSVADVSSARSSLNEEGKQPPTSPDRTDAEQNGDAAAGSDEMEAAKDAEQSATKIQADADEAIGDDVKDGDDGDCDEADDDVSHALPSATGDVDHNHLADVSRRKRDREGSLEPSLTPSKAETIPTKKNRLQSDLVAEAAKSALASSPPRSANVEGEKVGQIRKRVQDLNWKQRKEGHREQDEEEDEDDDDGEAKDQAPGDLAKDESTNDTAEVGSSAAKASSQPSFASFAKSSGFAASSSAGGSFLDPKDDKKATSKPALSTSTAAISSPPAASASPSRTQPTFSSFSKSSSPFGAATASVAGPSWLAGKSGGSAGGGGGMKPSSLGSMPGSSKAQGEHTSNSTPEPASPPPTGASAAKGLGFGAFAASNPYGSKSKSSSSRTSSPAGGDNKASEGGGHGTASPAGAVGAADAESNTTFDEVLKQGGGPSAIDERSRSGNKIETQFDKGQVDLRTGEEDETSVASVRAKLFIMSEDNSWKERGTGTVRCNVPKRHSEGSGARLIMRSEGVLRLILNIKLFKGMKINLEQDKFLRIVAFDNSKPVHYALRIGNASAASQFYRAVQGRIPTQDDDRSAAEIIA